MPINELEKHPFLNYHESIEYEKDSVKGIIIGSFPIYSITDTIDHNNVLLNQRDDTEETFMKFFYGSRKSELWKLLINIFNEHDFVTDNNINRTEKVQRAKRLLNNNKLLISDCIHKSNRIDYSSADIDLLFRGNGVEDWIIDNLEYNIDLIELLNCHRNIENIFFTSIIEIGNSPYSLFKEIHFDHEIIEIEQFNPSGKNWAKIISIDGRIYKIFLLPTPKPRTISFTENEQHPLFNNYLNIVDPILMEQIQFPLNQNQKLIISEHRKNFINECYSQALINYNLNFNGNPLQQ